MLGAPAAREEAAHLSGARSDFVASLPRRVEALRQGLRAVEEHPGDLAQRNGLLRRLHALGSAARVLGFASVAEALAEAETRLRRSDLAGVARTLDLLPSLVLGTPFALRPAEAAVEREAAPLWPLSALVFGSQALLDALIILEQDTHVERERTEDPGRARELVRMLGPDLVLVDADRPGARDLLEQLANEPLAELAAVIVVGDFPTPEAASAFVALGAARVLPKPVSPETLHRTVVELRERSIRTRGSREPVGELSVDALAERIVAEVRRGLLAAVEPESRGTPVNFGEGSDVLAAVWGAVARVRELVTLRSDGLVRFDPSGPEGAVPMVAWSVEDRRAGERGQPSGRAGEGVTLRGRRIVVADDDPAVVWFLSALLQAVGAEVIEAHDGARALKLAFESWPDLVVSDILMPKLDGFALCHEIKRDVAVRDVPVILLSWKEDLLQRVRELGADADGYLRKEAAASTVAERLREVLRPRARVEQRVLAGADVRGRLDGLTPRLVLELACSSGRDVRVSVRDAVYVYEVQIRDGRPRSAVRSAADGSHQRGQAVLAALLGVSAGRFAIEPDTSLGPVDFEQGLIELLKTPIEKARHALKSISVQALLSVTRVQIDEAAMLGYLGCTPEPARSLLRNLIAGASPRDLITSGGADIRLLEALLSDVARRGALLAVEGAAAPLSADSVPPGPALTPRLAVLPAIAALPDTGGDPVVARTAPLADGALSPAEASQKGTPEDHLDKLPFSSEVTPSFDALWDSPGSTAEQQAPRDSSSNAALASSATQPGSAPAPSRTELAAAEKRANPPPETNAERRGSAPEATPASGISVARDKKAAGSAEPRSASDARPRNPSAVKARQTAPKKPGSSLRFPLSMAIAFVVTFGLFRWVVVPQLVERESKPEPPRTRADPEKAKIAPSFSFEIASVPLAASAGVPPGKAQLDVEAAAADRVYLDGNLLGTGPVRSVMLSAGSHEVKLVRDGLEATEALDLRPDTHTRVAIRTKNLPPTAASP